MSLKVDHAFVHFVGETKSLHIQLPTFLKVTLSGQYSQQHMLLRPIILGTVNNVHVSE